MRITRSVRIAAPPEVVFDVVADPERQLEWQRGLVATEFELPYDPAAPEGAAFVKRIKEGPKVVEYRGRVEAHARPTRYATSIGSVNFTYRNEYTIAPDGDGARLEYLGVSDAATQKAGLAARVFGWLTRRIVDRQLARVRELAERAARGG
ncbi:MAG: SRPBCC family protein [Thermoleophilia bacterium]